MQLHEQERRRLHGLELVCERDVNSGCENQVVIFCSGRRVGYVNVTKAVLPAKPLVQFCDRPKIKRGPVLSALLEVREKIALFRNYRTLAEFMSQFFTERARRETHGCCARRNSVCGRYVVALMGVVNARKQIERSSWVFDEVEPDTAAKHRAQIYILQFIGQEIGADESENAGCQVVVVSRPTLHQ